MDSFPKVEVTLHYHPTTGGGNAYWAVEMTPIYDHHTPMPFIISFKETVRFVQKYISDNSLVVQSTHIFMWEVDARGRWCHYKTNTFTIHDLYDEAELAVLILQWQ